VTVVNKTDTLADRTAPPGAPAGGAMTAEAPFVDVVPVSALEGENVDRLIEVLVAHLPEAPRLFAAGRVSDQPEAQLAAEIVREKVIADLAQELPHSVAVTVDAIEPDAERRRPRAHRRRHPRRARLAEGHHHRPRRRAAQGGGDGGAPRARGLLGVRVHLTTRVKVAPDWQRDPRQLGRLGL
jgi:GTPase